MEDTTWEQRINALTHILTTPTTSPPLHSQFFIATQVPCYLHWDYPPILCNKSAGIFPSVHLKWAFLTFLKRVSGFNRPTTPWRSKCPYQIPPPIVLAKGVEEPKWGEVERREFARKRFRRGRLVNKVNPLIPLIIPNLLLLCLLFWDPLPEYTRYDR